MVNEREKLVELLDGCVYENVELDDGYVGYEVNNEQIADYLIAHGVTVQEPQEPITLKELRQMEGEPVFLVIENLDVQRWAILDFSGDERTSFQNGLRLSNEVYGKTWICYRHKPKEVQNG